MRFPNDFGVVILLSLISLLAEANLRATFKACTGDVISGVHDELSVRLDYSTDSST